METAYLKRTVGACLADGLAELAATRPGDPIEYLALWMLKYKQNTIQRAKDGELPAVHVEEDKENADKATSEAPVEQEEKETTAKISSEEKTPPPPPSMPRIDEEEENSG